MDVTYNDVKYAASGEVRTLIRDYIELGLVEEFVVHGDPRIHFCLTELGQKVLKRTNEYNAYKKDYTNTTQRENMAEQEHTLRAKLQSESDEEAETPPTLDELIEQASGYVAAKNYNLNAKVVLPITAYDKLQKSDRFGTWQVIYSVTKDGEPKKWGATANNMKALHDEYGIEKYEDLVGGTVTLLTIKNASGSHSFAIADFKK